MTASTHLVHAPHVEEAPRNLIFQNRCGNRLTVSFFEDRVELGLLYKPNAFRRKDLKARNFSNRDIATSCFRTVQWPDLRCGWFETFAYDPFHTRLEMRAPHGARNTIRILNFADENAFALTARQPLTLLFAPRAQFALRDGLLWEGVEDRGEPIWSFVAFRSIEDNRYRALSDGGHVVQLLDHDVLVIGAEDSASQMERVRGRFADRSWEDLVEENERLIGATLNRATIALRDREAQAVWDLNRRIAWSGLDAGGACFGALNRIYHLIWVRDGSMTACHMAMAGAPDFLEIWAPFLLGNPGRGRRDDGTWVPEFNQIVGSRWSKSEEDGIFYAVWSCFTHWRVTGDDRLVRGEPMAMLVEAIDAHLAKCWNETLEMMGSDTLGEDPLNSSPYYGYDVVTGQIAAVDHGAAPSGRQMERCHSLYHQVNTINVLSMALVLLEQRPDLKGARVERYRTLLGRLRRTVRERFGTSAGRLRSLLFTYADGEQEWRDDTAGIDWWEHAWALGQGPFYVDVPRQLAGARFLIESWPKKIDRSYGLCPWNVLVRFLWEHGISSEEHRELLADEVREALTVTERFPMPGALAEDHRAPHGWRALPFSAGSFAVAQTALVLAPLALGVAVRGAGSAEGITEFVHRMARICVTCEGEGDGVEWFELNGERFERCLQIPENRLRVGRNTLRIRRGASERVQLWGSDAELVDAGEEAGAVIARLDSPLPKQVWLRHGDRAEVTLLDEQGATLPVERETLAGTRLTLVRTEATGVVVVKVVQREAV